MTGPGPTRRTNPARRAVQIVLSIVVVALVFGFALPQFADFSKVWGVITAMTWLEIVTLALAAAWNIATYWLVMVASLPGSNVWQAMKVNQVSTAVTNTVPGGSAFGIAITYGMYSKYGFTRNEVSLSVLLSGLWNNFVKLALPVFALALLALQGTVTPGRAVAAAFGLGALVAVLALFALSLRSEDFALRAGDRAGRIATVARRLFRKPPVEGWGAAFAGFRSHALVLLRRRWLSLSAATLVSHLSLFFVLVLSLRHVGISDAEVSWVEVLAIFSFARLVTALPITPGGLGVVELVLIGGIVGADAPRAPAVAAVLVYRVLTYVVPIGFGGIAYARWRMGSEARAIRAEERRVGGESPLTGDGGQA